MNSSETIYSNDIAIVHLVSPIALSDNVQVAYLPPNNNDVFVGQNCTLTGWGRTCECLTFVLVTVNYLLRMVGIRDA